MIEAARNVLDQEFLMVAESAGHHVGQLEESADLDGGVVALEFPVLFHGSSPFPQNEAAISIRARGELETAASWQLFDDPYSSDVVLEKTRMLAHTTLNGRRSRADKMQMGRRI
jgi:hypothetical protein